MQKDMLAGSAPREKKRFEGMLKQRPNLAPERGLVQARRLGPQLRAPPGGQSEWGALSDWMVLKLHLFDGGASPPNSLQPPNNQHPAILMYNLIKMTPA